MSLLRYLVWLAIPACAAAQEIRFEVASVKLRPADNMIVMIGGGPSGARLQMEAMSLSDLVAWAYDVKPWQVTGGPNWAGVQFDRTMLDGATKRFDIAAKAEGNTERPPAEFREMMRVLLAERFRLAVHRESRETAVYALTIDKRGLKLHESASEAPGVLRMNERGRVVGAGATITQLAGWFSKANGVERPIVDHTELKGRYDFMLEWGMDASGPSIFTALPEQLGLRLEARREPIEMMVIDQAEIPREE